MSSVLSSVSTTSWKAYYCIEQVTATTPTNPIFIFLTNLSSFTINADPKYKEVKGSGTLLPYVIQFLNIKPVCKLSLQISDLGILTDLVSDTNTLTICFRNEIDGVYVILRGAIIDSCTIKAVNESDAFVGVELGVSAASIESSATAINGSQFAQPPKNSFVIPVQNIQIRNIGVFDDTTGKDTIEEWKSFELMIKKKLIRRINCTDGTTRAIAHVSSAVTFNITRSIMISDALQQQSDIIAGTTASLKLEMLSYPNSWSATLTGAKPSAIIKVSGVEEADGKDSQAMYKYIATGIEYSTEVSIVLTPPDAPVNQVGLTEIFTETWGEPAEHEIGLPPTGAETAIPSMPAIFIEDWS